VTLDEGDELIGAKITHGDNNYIFLGSHQGQAIRFAESAVPKSCPGVPANFLDARGMWPDKPAYDRAAGFSRPVF
jgi:DNA gyrase/topoisomerase IV subunit A